MDVDSDVESARINIDKHKMSQVLRNIVSNGLKFTPKGGKVTVKAEIIPSSMIEDMEQTKMNRNKNGDWFRIQITDTGPGIAKVRRSACAYISTQLLDIVCVGQPSETIQRDHPVFSRSTPERPGLWARIVE